MAHQVLPAHRPHDQLRTEAPKQREHSDKYVSAFTTGEPVVDISFTNPILAKSADHFKVGIDELTVNLGSLSMLEYGVGEVLFRIIRRGVDDEVHPNFYMIDGPAGDLEKWRNGFSFSVDRVYNTLQEVISRFSEISNAVNTYIRGEGLVNPDPGGWNPPLWTTEVVAAPALPDHIQITVTSNGQILFKGNQVFWANFVVEVPHEKYRQILFKTSNVQYQYISLDPGTGALRDPFGVAGLNMVTLPFADWDGAVNDNGELGIAYNGAGNLLNTLDRRVTLEVGCSLPIKNSPLIDHNVEAPDFVLGRYMFHKPYSMSAERDDNNHHLRRTNLISSSLGTQTLQGLRDRVVFHHLRPQQKINTLRLKLWSRVRTYNERTEKWGMKTIVCPVKGTDYWHIRLHFVSK